MDNKENGKASVAVSKLFLAVGPTLHYSHGNVQMCWALAAAAFVGVCLFWSKIVSGTFLPFRFEALSEMEAWRLGRAAATGVSIFEYPWQILVLGLTMGLLAIVPILISQLMSFSYSLVFLLAVFFVANLPGFALSLLVSCFAVACRPLRFRSRIIAIALCTGPQLLYWAIFGGARGVEPTEWGFSFAPWFCAWLAALVIAGVVLAIGHYTRYRPGLTWVVTVLVLAGAIGLFEWKIGFDELDYQFYVAENDPEQVGEFRPHSLTQWLDDSLIPEKRRFLAGLYYPTEAIPLREELKRQMQRELADDRWPEWFAVPEELQYQQKRDWLRQQYEFFLYPPPQWWMPSAVHRQITRRRSASRRAAIALYYEAMLTEYSPDLQKVGQEEVLQFYSDYADWRAADIWGTLYLTFPKSLESAEARWRIAKHFAVKKRFDEADAFLVGAQQMVQARLEAIRLQMPEPESLFRAFRRPAESVMTEVKLAELQRRLNELRTLIGPENRQGGPEAKDRLAGFIDLNPHSLDYASRLERLAQQVGAKDGLRDNVMLARAKLVADEESRAEQLNQLHREFANTDGGMTALYELTLLKIRRYQTETNLEQKRQGLVEARRILTDFVSLYPNSFYAEQVRKNLEALPKTE